MTKGKKDPRIADAQLDANRTAKTGPDDGTACNGCGEAIAAGHECSWYGPNRLAYHHGCVPKTKGN